MLSKNINSPSTSSLGRLFDGISSIIGLRHKVCYEGQAAMELEMASGELTEEIYDYDCYSGDIIKVFIKSIIQGIVHDNMNGVEPSRLSMRIISALLPIVLGPTLLKRNLKFMGQP